MRRSLLLATALIAISGPALSHPVNRGQVNRILDEGTMRGQVMLAAEHLADVTGPRLPNSSQMRGTSTTFLLNAANADHALPRPPLPTQPVVTDPFAYSDDDD